MSAHLHKGLLQQSGNTQRYNQSLASAHLGSAGRGGSQSSLLGSRQWECADMDRSAAEGGAQNRCATEGGYAAAGCADRAVIVRPRVSA